MKRRIMVLVAVMVFLLGAVIYVSGCSTTSSATTTTTTTTTSSSSSSSTTVPTHTLVGTWEGYWYDEAYFVGGPLSGTITQNGASGSGTGTIDLSSILWSGITIETGTAAGTVSGNNVTFTFSSGNVGNGSGTISGNNITGTGEVTLPMDFGNFTITGTIDASGNTVIGSFVFASGGYGTVEVYRQ